jgi:Lipoprotein confined to pathogenic Mycobacterium
MSVRIIAALITLLMLSGCGASTTKDSTVKDGSTNGTTNGNAKDGPMPGGPMPGGTTTDGTTTDGTTTDGTMSAAFDTLLKRPNLAEVEADYQSMVLTIQERLVAEVGIAPWVRGKPAIGGLCGGDLIDLEDAQEGYLDAGVSIGNLPDARWGQAVAIVTEVAGEHGFGEPGVIVDAPGDHEISLRGTYQGELIFGTGAGTILTVRTGCHLTEQAHTRGTYLPPKEY